MTFGQFLRDTGLKLLALLLAVAIWFGIASDRKKATQERAFDIPLAFTNVPNNLIMVDPVRESVAVRIRGALAQLPQNITIPIDMADARPGRVRVLIRPQSLNLPENFEVISMDPATFEVKLEPRRNKVVPIRPFIVGELPKGYSYDPADIVVEPATALVSGPLSRIRDFGEVYTDRIILTGRRGTFRQSVGLVSDASLVRVLEPLTANIIVTVNAPPEPDPEPLTETTMTTAPLETEPNTSRKTKANP